eukprot:scaffold431_cov334-Pavlova_lutheri.AAC.29
MAGVAGACLGWDPSSIHGSGPNFLPSFLSFFPFVPFPPPTGPLGVPSDRPRTPPSLSLVPPGRSMLPPGRWVGDGRVDLSLSLSPRGVGRKGREKGGLGRTHISGRVANRKEPL